MRRRIGEHCWGDLTSACQQVYLPAEVCTSNVYRFRLYHTTHTASECQSVCVVVVCSSSTYLHYWHLPSLTVQKLVPGVYVPRLDKAWASLRRRTIQLQADTNSILLCILNCTIPTIQGLSAARKRMLFIQLFFCCQISYVRESLATLIGEFGANWIPMLPANLY